MIKRTDDYSLFSDKEMAKIAKAVNQADNKQLFDTFDDANEARISAKELKVKGFDSDVVQAGNSWKVYVVTPDKISLKEAEQSGCFKKLAWGRYCFERESSLEMHSYPFDDGSIWKMAVDENGNHVLVKEVDDENEDSVLRKTASTTKTAALNIVDDMNFKTVLGMFLTVTPLNQVGQNVLSAIFDGNLQSEIVEILNGQLEDYISNSASNQGLNDQSKLEELNGLISEKLTAAEFNSLDDVDNFIAQYSENEVVGTQGEQSNDSDEFTI